MTRNVARLAGLIALCILPAQGMSQSLPARSASARTPASTVTPRAVPPYVRLYEGELAKQNTVCSIPITEQPYFRQFYFQKHEGECRNDEARSLSFENIPAGTVVRLYDDPKCGVNDDWVEFIILKRVAYTYNWKFEFSNVDTKYGDGEPVYSQTYHRVNGLDGKVSCMVISVPAPQRSAG